ncbi:hypothetical protein ACGFI9_30460 [Micromonospora sp. NPDC048930]|uniref:hypothetical protein n=1 Tax=Micromonospora sp. NPDC048930 TaxID=3364261 RepID=UPI0037146815
MISGGLIALLLTGQTSQHDTYNVFSGRPYTTRLTQDTGFSPTFDLATAVADQVAWRADNPR